jgi:transcriptional regulator with XRE-family HTH domain
LRGFVPLICASVLASAATGTVIAKAFDDKASGTSHLLNVAIKRELYENNFTTQALDKIQSQLGLTKSHLARTLQVERPTIYQWKRGSQPRQESAQRIAALAGFADEWKAAGLGSARASWNMKPIGEIRTLGELLTAPSLDAAALTLAVRGFSTPGIKPERVRPQRIYGFQRDDGAKQKRRLRDIFAPSASDKD